MDFDAVLLLSFGGPEGPEQVMPFLENVTRGRGIPPERLEHLFDSCLQPQKAVPRHGLGLGLPLCRAIAERHGGRIAVESVPQQGTRFTVSLPDRQLGAQVSDVSPLYDSGFNRPLLGLADALPAGAYTVRNQD